ncbi:hypothetical protein [Actinocrispum wychmicini]|uniref:Uncharacterized protein n=1 Tax=Actinocrispum wychmicini TaxID=1213861 RepID=A0A4R2JHJ5_9PSEU|nr:hypothetical protein [Actinocrispum wychmicini]TCO59321.1 hypothetical protein EV192_104162 [Actinocrispum wychmicini]
MSLSGPIAEAIKRIGERAVEADADAESRPPLSRTRPGAGPETVRRRMAVGAALARAVRELESVARLLLRHQGELWSTEDLRVAEHLTVRSNIVQRGKIQAHVAVNWSRTGRWWARYCWLAGAVRERL